MHLFLLATGVRETKAHDSAYAYRGVLLAHALIQKTVRRVAIVAHVHVDEANGEQASGNNLLLHAVQVVVDTRQTVLDVPKKNRTKTRGCGHLSMILILEDPAHVRARAGGRVTLRTLSTLGRREKLVLTESGIDKRVDKRRSQVRTSAVDGSTSGCAAFHQVRLVDIFRKLSLHHVKIACEGQIVRAQVGVAHDGLQLLKLICVRHFARTLIELERMTVSREHVAHLTSHELILSGVESLFHRLLHAKTARHAHGFGVLLHLHENGVRHLEHLRILGLGQIARAAEEVQARARVVLFSDVIGKNVQSLNLNEQIHRFGFGVVLHVERDDLVDEPHEI